MVYFTFKEAFTLFLMLAIYERHLTYFRLIMIKIVPVPVFPLLLPLHRMVYRPRKK